VPESQDLTEAGFEMLADRNYQDACVVLARCVKILLARNPDADKKNPDRFVCARIAYAMNNLAVALARAGRMDQAVAVIQEANEYLDHDNDYLEETQSCYTNMSRIERSMQNGQKVGPLFEIYYAVYAWETREPDEGTEYIASLSHNAETSRLIVELADGQEYQYAKVSYRDFEEFAYSDDPRRHHLHEVIGKFPRVPA
jgi:tetratricopeptide (TPR) repeat protein